MYPPLRTEEDVYAIKEGLRDGTIDAIATDHAPHADFEKELEFENAPNGVIGLQTALPCAITELIKPGILTMREVIEKFTLGPKKILNLPIYGIKEEEYANIVIIDTNLKWIPKREDFISKSKNSPFIGKELIGLPIYTIYRGKVYFPPNTV
jgi:dihydroorotase